MEMTDRVAPAISGVGSRSGLKAAAGPAHRNPAGPGPGPGLGPGLGPGPAHLNPMANDPNREGVGGGVRARPTRRFTLALASAFLP